MTAQTCAASPRPSSTAPTGWNSLPPEGDPVLGASPAIGSYTAVPYDSDVSNPKTFNAVLPSGVAACETSWVFPRAPDVALFRIYSTSIGVGSYRDVYAIDNHFKSGPDTCVAHRTEQANYNAALVAFIQAANPSARVVVGGDFNVYPRPDDIALGASDQLGSLYAPTLGLTNLWDVLVSQKPEAAYSYVYLGQAQTLDQMFINQAMLTDLVQFRIAHINSDFPAEFAGDTARGTSDHDPNVAVFSLNDPPTVDAGGPYTVNEGSSVTLNASGTDPEGQPLTYAWDLDNNGTFETPGQSVSFAGVDGPTSPTVNVQVTDNGGLTAVASATVTVANVAPSVGPITAPTAPVLINTVMNTSAVFTDPGRLDTHTALWDWGDGSTSAGTVTETNGSGSVAGSHTYSAVGQYKLTLTVTDKDGAASQVFFETIVVYNPNGGSVVGVGWFNSPAGAYVPKPSVKGKAVFNFVAAYRKGAAVPTGTVDFILPAGLLEFHSTSLAWMTIHNPPASLCGVSKPCASALEIKGTGKVRNGGTYQFMVWAFAGNPNTFRIKIWSVGGGGAETVLYDNLTLLPFGGGTIILLK